MMFGDIVYFELPILTHKIDETITFYKDVFGWTIQESFMTKQRYFVVQTPGQRLFGGFDSSLKPSRDSMNLYIYVDLIDETLHKIKQNYPQIVILKNKTLISKEDGSYALLLDPSGNKIGINEYPKSG